jgi:predicted DNA-binding helix-hairpin-helix protein
MDIREKLNLLGQAARFDDCVSPARGISPVSNVSSGGFAEERGLFAQSGAMCTANHDMVPYVSHLTTPTGRRTPVLKVLQTSFCQNDCLYCGFRAGKDFRRARFTPDELAQAFDLIYRSGVVEGLFLSSGVAGTVLTMDEMLATAELVRVKYGFRGYLHLKLLPGAEGEQIARAVELADRVSANLEAPTAERLAALAPQKRMADLIGPLQTAAHIARRGEGRQQRTHATYGGPVSVQAGRSPMGGALQPGAVRLGMSTQFVVGPAGESDRELLVTAQRLYRQVGLARAYYSAFSPVVGTPLEAVPPTDPRREHRLYQADFLLRHYGFSVEALPFDQEGCLSKETDPKTAWAQAHPECFPVEVNRAPYGELVRIPGIGPISANAILAARRQGMLREVGDLRRLGVKADRAASYVLLAGKRPPYQLPLPL